MRDFYSLAATDIDGNPFDFSTLKGKKILVVNTASFCGYTPQYQQLEELYANYHKSHHFEILGFPCNQFGQQEPEDESGIKSFCMTRFHITFPMMQKVDVMGAGQHPVYSWLTKASENGQADHTITWNFQKFLVDENGQLVRSAAPGEDPMSAEILNWLGITA